MLAGRGRDRERRGEGAGASFPLPPLGQWCSRHISQSEASLGSLQRDGSCVVLPGNQAHELVKPLTWWKAWKVCLMAEAVPFSLPSTQEVWRGVVGAEAGASHRWESKPARVSLLRASTVSSLSMTSLARRDTPSHSGPSSENWPAWIRSMISSVLRL